MSNQLFFPEVQHSLLSSELGKDQDSDAEHTRIQEQTLNDLSIFFNPEDNDPSQIGMSFVNATANFDYWYNLFDHSKLEQAVALAGLTRIQGSPTSIGTNSFIADRNIHNATSESKQQTNAAFGSTPSFDTGSMSHETNGLSSSPTMIACDLCGRLFKKRSSIARHKNAVHLGVRPFSCTICGFSFQQRCDLRKHIQSVHKQERPFSCEVRGCKAAFSRRAKLRKHFSTVHLKERNFVCVICNMAFGEKSNMNKHIRAVHLQLRKHACSWCPATFKELGHCTKHMNTQHKNHVRL